MDQQPAQHRAADLGEAHQQAVQAERGGPLLARRELGCHDRHDLRHHDAGEATLHDPGTDQHSGGERRPGHDRGDRETRDAEHEDLPSPDDVAEPASGHQHQCEGERVTGHDPLTHRVGGMEIALDLGQRHVDDGHVDEVHERGEQHDEEGEPAAPATPTGDRSGRRRRADGHHCPDRRRRAWVRGLIGNVSLRIGERSG